MKMRTRASIAAVAVASVVGGAAAGAVLNGPATAAAQEADTEASTTADGHTTISDVLAGLVDEGVITQDQADAVAAALAEARPDGRRGHGHHRGGFLRGSLSDVADLLGIDGDELVAAMRDGSSLAEVAEAHGVTVDEIVDLLVAGAQERLDAAVEAGRLTEEDAEERVADLEERITDMVNGTFEMELRRDFGRRGPHSDTAPEDADEALLDA